jgi:hypothetical protein
MPDVKAYTKYSDEFQAAEQELVQIMRDQKATAEGREQIALIRTMIDIFRIAEEPCAQAGISKDELFGLGADGLWAFLHALPSRLVDFELQNMRYRDLNLPRKPGDLMDMGFLGTAVAYCDVVVTEKSWSNLLHRTELCERFNTTVLSDVRDLGPILVREAT